MMLSRTKKNDILMTMQWVSLWFTSLTRNKEIFYHSGLNFNSVFICLIFSLNFVITSLHGLKSRTERNISKKWFLQIPRWIDHDPKVKLCLTEALTLD